MKKVISILLVLMVILVGYYVFVKAETTVNEDIYTGITYNNGNFYELKCIVDDWCKVFYGEDRLDKIDENGYYIGTGVLNVHEFEDTYGVECNYKNLEEKLGENYVLSKFEISKVGCKSGYSIFRLEAKSETEPIGYVYEYGEEIGYYEGELYFIAVYNDKY